jgi:hypothetical protein
VTLTENTKLNDMQNESEIESDKMCTNQEKRDTLRKVKGKEKTSESNIVKSKTVTLTENTKLNDMQNESEIESDKMCTNQEKEKIGKLNMSQGQTVTEIINKTENNCDENTGEIESNTDGSTGNNNVEGTLSSGQQTLESVIPLLQRAQNERIILNIGGQRFETSRVTLQREPCSILSEVVSEGGMVPKNGNIYFIDRDPAHFRFVLNYLRNGACDLRTLPHDLRYLYELYYEARYYRLPSLVHAIISKIEQVSVVGANLEPLPMTAHKLGL